MSSKQTRQGKDDNSFDCDSTLGWFRKTRDIAGPTLPSAALAFNFIIESLLASTTWNNVTRTKPSDSIERLEFFNDTTSMKIVDIELISATEWKVSVVSVAEEPILFEDGEAITFEDGEAIIFE